MSTEDKIQRSVLPIPDEKHVGLTTYDAKDPETKFPPIRDMRPPKGAPNVLVILLDDVGFGASSAFGGPVNTPAAERLANNGLKLNRFHTTALCAPTRQALLTGRNHHSVNMGGITEIATSAPGYTSVLPKDKAPLAMTLKLNGYATAQFGKCHEVPVWQTSPMGPFDSWPSGGGGFEYFYGFIGGEADQYYPGIYEGTTALEPNKTPEEGYHFTEDMTNKAIAWVRQQKALKDIGNTAEIKAYRQAQYVMVALVDELLLLEMDWQGAAAWQHELLERRFFGTSSAGRDFFRHLDRLPKEGDEVNVEGFEIRVLAVKEQRILRVRVARGKTQAEAQQAPTTQPSADRSQQAEE